MPARPITEAPTTLQNLLTDIDAQPVWRGDAATYMAWRDNEQWSYDQVAYLEELGLNPLQVNLIAPAMDSVYGEEVKHRVDWMVSAAAEEHEEMAEGINHIMNDEMRLANANDACSEAYMAQASVGIGWIHVTKNHNPLIPGMLRVEEVHRDEMFWDMRARSKDLREDCRWLARRRFMDKDEAKAFFPKKYHEIIDFTYSDWQTIDISTGGPDFNWYQGLHEYTEPIELIMDNHSHRQMVAVYEVYYKEFQPTDLLMTHMGAVQMFDQQNPVHLEILAAGMGFIDQQVPIPVVKQAWFIGPNIVWDGPSPEPHHHFPYVPFFGLRKDAKNTPMGLVERMIGAQEQYNRAIVEIQRILRSRRIEKDEDALPEMSDQQALHEINRTDGVINKRRGADFQVVREWEKINALEGICARAREEINAASGIYQTFQGQTEPEQSGIAIESIAELGAQSLAKIKANYQYSRKMVGDLAFYHIVNDVGINTRVVNIPQELGQNKRQVILNNGMDNRVSMLRAQVVLQDIHTSSGYKQHTHMRIGNMIDSLPDDLKGPLLPFWLESSEMPKKEQAIDAINKVLGHVADEEQRELIEAQEAEHAQNMRQLEYRDAEAEVKEKEASAEDKKAQAMQHTAQALKTRAETAQLIRDFKMRNAINVTPDNQAGKPADPRQPRPPEASGGPPTKPAGNALPRPTQQEVVNPARE